MKLKPPKYSLEMTKDELEKLDNIIQYALANIQTTDLNEIDKGEKQLIIKNKKFCEKLIGEITLGGD